MRVSDDSVFEPEEDFQLHLGSPISEHWSTAMVGARDLATVTITNEEDGQSQAPPLLSGDTPMTCDDL